MTIDTNPTLLVLGAGPAGLTAGYLFGLAYLASLLTYQIAKAFA